MAVKGKAVIGDFLELGANAFVAGLAAAIALSVVPLLLTTTAQAATLNDAKTGQLLLRTGNPVEYVVAPTVATEVPTQVNVIIPRTRLIAECSTTHGTEFVEGVYVFPLPEGGRGPPLGAHRRARHRGVMQEKGGAQDLREGEVGRKEGGSGQATRPNLFPIPSPTSGPTSRCA